MKSNAVTLFIWLALLIAVFEINVAVFNITYHTYTNPKEGVFFLGTLQTDIMLFAVSVATYGMAGWLIAWRAHAKFKSIILALLIGTLGLGLEFSSSYPWFLLMPSHPDIYDRILAFLGPSIPPLSSIIGALAFMEWRRRKNETNAL